MTLYLISGLGVDERAFQRLQLDDSIRVKHLSWVEQQKGEALPQYAQRMAAGIDTTEPFLLAGLSFGGMVAIEIARVTAPQAVILISSVTSPAGIPAHYRLAGMLRLHKVIPARLLLWPNAFTFWLFGACPKEEKDLLRQILRDTSPRFMKWAIGSILSWRQSPTLIRTFRIHGDCDRILPLSGPADVVVKGAGHLMVFSHAGRVSEVLCEYIRNQLDK